MDANAKIGITFDQYPLKVSASSKEGSMKFLAIEPEEIRSRIDKRSGLWGAREQVSADQRLLFLSVRNVEND